MTSRSFAPLRTGSWAQVGRCPSTTCGECLLSTLPSLTPGPWPQTEARGSVLPLNPHALPQHRRKEQTLDLLSSSTLTLLFLFCLNKSPSPSQKSHFPSSQILSPVLSNLASHCLFQEKGTSLNSRPKSASPSLGCVLSL